LKTRGRNGSIVRKKEGNFDKLNKSTENLLEDRDPMYERQN